MVNYRDLKVWYLVMEMKLMKTTKRFQTKTTMSIWPISNPSNTWNHQIIVICLRLLNLTPTRFSLWAIHVAIRTGLCLILCLNIGIVSPSNRFITNGMTVLIIIWNWFRIFPETLQIWSWCGIGWWIRRFVRRFNIYFYLNKTLYRR